MSPCVTVPLGDSALPVHACDLLSDVTVPEVGQCPCVAVTLWMVVLGCNLDDFCEEERVK